MNLKSELVAVHSHPPFYIPLASAIKTPSILAETGSNRFDVILITRGGRSWDAISALPIRQLSADPSFVFLWVGKGDEEGLDKGPSLFC